MYRSSDDEFIFEDEIKTQSYDIYLTAQGSQLLDQSDRVTTNAANTLSNSIDNFCHSLVEKINDMVTKYHGINK